jgi:hypothetical protein
MIPKKYLTTVLPICFLILLTALFFTITEAEAGGYPWKNHAKPYVMSAKTSLTQKCQDIADSKGQFVPRHR